MDTERHGGELYLCATPIGNLGDITDRVKQVLKDADLIAAEDTRHSMQLLNHFQIKTPLTSYHEHNKYDKARELVQKLQEGKKIALISDAGTPILSDPGEVLVSMCIDAGIRVTSLPGPSAAVTALTLSGLPARRFAFEGFLPTDKKERNEVLSSLQAEERTVILYEAPHRLKETLKRLSETMGCRRTAICRELTKIHEEVLRMTLAEAAEYYTSHEPRGEYVLVIEGRPKEELAREKAEEYADMSIAEHVALYEGLGSSRKEAMKKAAFDRGISRRDVYQALLKETDGGMEK